MREGEDKVDRALDVFLRRGASIHPDAVGASLGSTQVSATPAVDVAEVRLDCYDRLLETAG